MAVLRMPDIRKLSSSEAGKKLTELQSALLELAGEGKKEKMKPVRKAIARLNMYIAELARKKRNPKTKTLKN